jgi:ABC-type antimicrobial peptide transport system permease subunit
MIVRQAIRNLLASKLRLFLTSLAVVLGVGFVVGALVLGATINKAFDGVFDTANKGVAVEVRGTKTVSEADRQRVPRCLRRSAASTGSDPPMARSQAPPRSSARMARRRACKGRPRWVSVGPTTRISTHCTSRQVRRREACATS